jgi:tRNA(Ile)-lysidine synthase
MELQLKEHLDRNFPFLGGSTLLLAVSGGVDSMVLCHLLKSLNYDIAIAHCNFNLRGEESDGDEKLVKEYTEKETLKFHVTVFDTVRFASDSKLSVQVAARQLRYIWFNELMADFGYKYLLTAHHLDDNIETLLINFTRGTGLEGLTGIPQQNENIIRPLLPFTRREIEDYAKQNNINWREDSSNATDKYLRNKLRHTVIPVLKELNPSFTDSFKNTINHLQQAQSLVEDASVIVYKQVVEEKEGQKHFNISQFKRLPNYKAYLYQWLHPFGFTAWDDVYSLGEAQSGKQVVSGSHRLIKNRNVLILEPIKENDTAVYILNKDGIMDYPIRLSVNKVDTLPKDLIKTAVYVDNEHIKFPLFVRKWQEGDYFYPIGMGGQKKKVSKYFKDEKMSLPEKEDIWLLCSGEAIVWIIGRRADERFKVTEETTQILKIEVLP